MYSGARACRVMEGAAGLPERPVWLSFGLPGSGPGVTKCAHLVCLGWSRIHGDRSLSVYVEGELRWSVPCRRGMRCQRWCSEGGERWSPWRGRVRVGSTALN